MASNPSPNRSSTALTAAATSPPWQEKFEYFREMGMVLYENQHLSDVVLHCGVASAQIKAHKLILAAQSSVFEEMFFGGQKASLEFQIEEDVGVVEVLLKMVYGFDTPLLTRDNVLHVLGAAEKYKVHGAIKRCERWIEGHMDATHCLFWLEAAQQFPPGIPSNVTVEKCWKYLDKFTAEILHSPEFLEINKSLLVEILKRNSLHIDEYAVYEAALKWANRASKRFYLAATPRPKRAALGEALYQIRFTLMSAKEFAEGPAQSGILLPEEISSILIHMASDKVPPFMFVTEPRIIIASGTFQVERFPATFGKRQWIYEGGVLDAVSFSVDRDITLVGCGLYTCGKEAHEVNIKVFTGATNVLRLQETSDLAVASSTKYLTGPACIRSVEFSKALLIQRSTPCTIQCGIVGRDTDFGTSGKGTASAEVKLDNGIYVLYRFTFVPGAANKQHCIRNLTSSGQIPTILFRA